MSFIVAAAILQFWIGAAAVGIVVPFALVRSGLGSIGYQAMAFIVSCVVRLIAISAIMAFGDELATSVMIPDAGAPITFLQLAAADLTVGLVAFLAWKASSWASQIARASPGGTGVTALVSAAVVGAGRGGAAMMSGGAVGGGAGGAGRGGRFRRWWWFGRRRRASRRHRRRRIGPWFGAGRKEVHAMSHLRLVHDASRRKDLAAARDQLPTLAWGAVVITATMCGLGYMGVTAYGLVQVLRGAVDGGERVQSGLERGDLDRAFGLDRPSVRSEPVRPESARL